MSGVLVQSLASRQGVLMLILCINGICYLYDTQSVI